MATLRRCHTPVPWGAQVENIVWEKSKVGSPRHRRPDRPLLTHDPGWDWDGTRILFGGQSIIPDSDEKECIYAYEDQPQDDGYYSMPSERTHATLSLLDITRHRVTKRRTKVRSGIDDFEVVRVPNMAPAISDEEAGLVDSWKLDDWEKLDVLSFKRTYAEVAQGFADGKDPLHMSCCTRLAPSCTEDDSWEHL